MLEKHETPAELDEFFEREEITREEYADFWGEYWRDVATGKTTLDEFMEEWSLSEPDEPEPLDSDFAAFWRNL
jgi:hypothetical protein